MKALRPGKPRNVKLVANGLLADPPRRAARCCGHVAKVRCCGHVSQVRCCGHVSR